MNEAVIQISLLLHILCCAVCFVLFRLRVIRMNMSLFPMICFIPVFGLICLLFAERKIRSERAAMRNEISDSYGITDNGYSKIDMDEGDRPGAVVPLEEAILINDVQTRRKVMIDILHREPAQYLDLLKVASLNEDAEVTHYATTTIIEIQRNYELAIQNQLSLVQNNPSDIDMLDNFIDILCKYIDSGLLEGHLLEKQRLLYSQQLQKRIELDPYAKEIYFRIIENESDSQRYAQAEKAFKALIRNWPDDENVWLAGIRICMESNNKELEAFILEEIKVTTIKWSSTGKERLNFLYGPEMLRTLANCGVLL